MDLQTLLDQRQITKYHLSKVSGVPKTTIMDICAGRSEIERCSAKTVRQLAKALDCTMEDIMELSSPYDSATGLPKDKSYLERGLPPFLMESIAAMKAAWKKLDGENRIFAGTAIIAIFRRISTTQRSTRSSIRSRHGICGRSI